MHISVGKFSGREIEDSPERGPLTTRELTVKEQMFILIGSRIHEATVLDIHDINGMCGIESLSRGAKKVTFVGSNKKDNEIIRKNLSSLGVTKEEAEVIEGFFTSYIAELKKDDSFDVIFFEVVGIGNVGLLSKAVSHLTDRGVMIASIPLTGGFEAPNEIRGACIQESRDCEQRKVLVVTKDCSVNLSN